MGTIIEIKHKKKAQKEISTQNLKQMIEYIQANYKEEESFEIIRQILLKKGYIVQKSHLKEVS